MIVQQCMESDMGDYAAVIGKTLWKLFLYFILGYGVLAILYFLFAMGIGIAVVNIHQANAPEDRVFKYVDCDRVYPMMRDERCKPK